MPAARSSAGTPAATWAPPTPRRVRAVSERLRAVYGRPLAQPHGHPLAELVLTVLSQSTNDRNRDVAYLRLRARFPTWEAVRDAPLEEVEEAIRPGGISRVKSVRIQQILRAISERPGPVAPAADGVGRSAPGRGDLGRVPVSVPSTDGEPSLDWLEHASVQEGRAYLMSLPGVGRKTAACVLLFAFGLRDVPVDTHVSRVGGRLGLLRPGAPLDEQHDQMLALTPPGQELELHLNLLRHGRRTCYARSPACRACALARMCPSRAQFQGSGQVGSPRPPAPTPAAGPRRRSPRSAAPPP